MKYFAFIILFAGLTSQAGQPSKSCTFQDYQAIQNAVANQEVRSGSELRNTLLDILAQEAAPACAKLNLGFGVSIPGQKMKSYLIDNRAGQVLRVTLISSLEENKNYVLIKAENQK